MVPHRQRSSFDVFRPFCWSCIVYLNLAGVSVESLNFGPEYAFLRQLYTRFACLPIISLYTLLAEISDVTSWGGHEGSSGCKGRGVCKSDPLYNFHSVSRKAKAWKLQLPRELSLCQHLSSPETALSTLVQVMAWCRQAISHHLSQIWQRQTPVSPGTTKVGIMITVGLSYCHILKPFKRDLAELPCSN